MNLDFAIVVVIAVAIVLAVIGLVVWRLLVAPLREFGGLETYPAHVVSARVRVSPYEVLRGTLTPTEIGVSLTYWTERGPDRAEIWDEPGKLPAAVRAVARKRGKTDAAPPRTDPTPIVDPTGEAHAAATRAAREEERLVTFEPPLEAAVFLSGGRVVSWELTRGRGTHARP